MCEKKLKKKNGAELAELLPNFEHRYWVTILSFYHDTEASRLAWLGGGVVSRYKLGTVAGAG